MSRWTLKEYSDYLERHGLPAAGVPVDVSRPPFKLPANEAGALARAEPRPEKMNKTEQAYAGLLEARKLVGEVVWYRFEPLKLRLADGAFYTPDFGVVPREGIFELHETKGFWREAARVRIKVAASLYPFRFIAIKRKPGGGWAEERFA